MRSATVALAVLGAGIVLRVLFLGSDPAYYAWAGHITDEGRWVEQARHLVLFGAPDLSNWLSVVHLVVAPLYQAAAWVSFSLLGIGFASARLVSALSGIALLLALWLFGRRRLTLEALLLTVVAVALQRDMVFLSRVAIPEMPAMLFQLLAFMVLVSAPRSTGRASLGGLLTAVGLGFKATGMPVVPVLVIVILVVHEAGDPSSRVRRTGAFLGTVVGSAVLVLVAGALLTGLDLVGRLSVAVPTLTDFTRLASRYQVMSYLISGDHTVPINLYLMGVWIVAGLLMAVGKLPREPVRVVWLGSVTWAVGWLAVAALVRYFPERYAFHGLVPLALGLGSGVTLLQRVGAEEVVRSFGRLAGARRVGLMLWLAVPTGVLLCPVLVGTADVMGIVVERLSHRYLLMVTTTAAVAGLGWRARSPRMLLHGLCILPVAAVLVWLVGGAVGFSGHDFWVVRGMPALLRWVSVLAIGGALAGLLWMRRDRFDVPGLAVLAVGALATLGLAQMLPGVVRPTYTVADAAASIDEAYGTTDLVWSRRSTSVFLGTTIDYSEGLIRESQVGLPDIIVDLFELPAPHPNEIGYRLVRVYPINLGQEYLERHDDAPVLRVWRREP